MILESSNNDLVTIEYGTVYPDGHVDWTYQPQRETFDIRTKIGQEAKQENYDFEFKGLHAKSAGKLKFIRRTRTIVYYEAESFEAL